MKPDFKSSQITEPVVTKIITL